MDRGDTAEMETPEAIAAVDDLLAAVGLEHGRRKTQTQRQHQTRPMAKSHAQKSSRPRTESPELDIIQVPGWDAYPWLIHGFSTRQGGVSKAYSNDRATGELNLAFSDADPATNVHKNRARFLKQLGCATQPVTMKQVHSATVHEILHAPQAADATLTGDGAITAVPGVALTIQTADCVPVLLVDPVHKAVGAFHAGWRGTVKRIVERGVGDMRRTFGSDPSQLLAAIGPSIGSCCYAVGDEVIAEFTSQFAYAAELFHEVSETDPIRLKYPLLFLTARAPGHSDLGPQIHLDLWQANRRQLVDAGLRPESIWVAEACTSCHPERFFSYRAEQGFTGRMMAVAGIR